MNNERDPVPLYTAEPSKDDMSRADADEEPARRGRELFPVTAWPEYGHPVDHMGEDTRRTIRNIILEYFSAITSQKSETVNHFLTSKLVTTSTTDVFGRTPLIAAAEKGSSRMVLLLADFDADVNAMGRFDGEMRTPLMVAAQTGSLPLVKPLLDVLHADDGIIAADGQLALRLAAEHGHKEIVDILPLRRGGGWRRWKHHHAKAVTRAKEALKRIGYFVEFTCWIIPKAIIWDLPMHCVLRPLKRHIFWSWHNKAHFLPWCRRKLGEVPERARRAAIWVKNHLTKFLKVIQRFRLPHFLTHTLPRFLHSSAKFLWTLLTVKIPTALKICLLWLWDGVKTISNIAFHLLRSIISLMHTAVSATLNFFRNITVADVLHGLREVLHLTFVTFPMRLGGWIAKFVVTSYKVLEQVAGSAGRVIWWVGRGSLELVIYIPRKLGVAVGSLGGSVVKAGHEIAVWLNPKGA